MSLWVCYQPTEKRVYKFLQDMRHLNMKKNIQNLNILHSVSGLHQGFITISLQLLFKEGDVARNSG